MLFSQRQGLAPVTKLAQRESIDSDLRNKIWNVLQLTLWDKWEPIPDAYTMRSRAPQARQIEHLMELIWFEYFKEALDRMPGFNPGHSRSSYNVLRNWFMDGVWNDVFDLLEFIVKNVQREWREELRNFLNKVLKDESSAYRFVEFEIAEITDENEIESVESAVSISPRSISAHLKRALELLTDKKIPTIEIR